MWGRFFFFFGFHCFLFCFLVFCLFLGGGGLFKALPCPTFKVSSYSHLKWPVMFYTNCYSFRLSKSTHSMCALDFSQKISMQGTKGPRARYSSKQSYFQSSYIAELVINTCLKIFGSSSHAWDYKQTSRRTFTPLLSKLARIEDLQP